MKNKLIILNLLLGLGAFAEMHEFKLPDGRAIKAEIQDYNEKTKVVNLKLGNGRVKKIDSTIFVVEDQHYINEWNAAKAFRSDRLLKITCDDQVVDRRKEEEYKDLRDTEGNVENHLMKETKFETIGFEVEFQNLNEIALNGLRMEYVIYYEQSKESFKKPEVMQYTYKGEMAVPTLPSKKKTAVSTKTVEVHEDNINAISFASGNERVGGEGEVHGLRARVFMKMASGEEMMREFCSPSTLSDKKFPWKN